ncbi:chorismate mutase [Treponema primitia]|uniref:chorismate mutase n=1 Tax=Treponema primitia TaxID=88058 RepID=UPI00025556B6|nr:chorismate mutase [Treponema primitia]
MTADKRLFALRGATQCKNDPQDMVEQVAALYDELLVRNKLEEPDLVSVIFSVTADLDVLNPATALRKSGRAGETALFSLQESAAVGSLPKTIRVLIHCYMAEGAVPRYVYRNGAEVLRPDIS